MDVLLILAHPCPDSFNHAISDRVLSVLRELGHQCIFHDLYAEDFEPCLPCDEIALEATVSADVQHYCDELTAADALVIIHPNWWGQMPAILKGWVDRVIRNSVAFEYPEGSDGTGMPRGLLANMRAVVFNTADTPPEHEARTVGDPLEAIWKRSVFGFSGLTDVRRRMFAPVASSSRQQRRAWLAEAEDIIRDQF